MTTASHRSTVILHTLNHRPKQLQPDGAATGSAGSESDRPFQWKFSRGPVSSGTSLLEKQQDTKQWWLSARVNLRS